MDALKPVTGKNQKDLLRMWCANDECLVVNTRPGIIRILSLPDLEEISQFAYEGWIHDQSQLLLRDGVLYLPLFTGEKYRIIALEIATGNIRWQGDFPDGELKVNGKVSQHFLGDKLLVWLDRYSFVLDPESGAVLASNPDSGTDFGSQALGEFIYAQKNGDLVRIGADLQSTLIMEDVNAFAVDSRRIYAFQRSNMFKERYQDIFTLIEADLSGRREFPLKESNGTNRLLINPITGNLVAITDSGCLEIEVEEPKVTWNKRWYTDDEENIIRSHSNQKFLLTHSFDISNEMQEGRLVNLKRGSVRARFPWYMHTLDFLLTENWIIERRSDDVQVFAMP